MDDMFSWYDARVESFKKLDFVGGPSRRGFTRIHDSRVLSFGPAVCDMDEVIEYAHVLATNKHGLSDPEAGLEKVVCELETGLQEPSAYRLIVRWSPPRHDQPFLKPDLKSMCWNFELIVKYRKPSETEGQEHIYYLRQPDYALEETGMR